MPLVGGAIMPHGALILDPTRKEMPADLSAKAQRLYDACLTAADEIANLQPDLILLYTPHGQNHENREQWDADRRDESRDETTRREAAA